MAQTVSMAETLGGVMVEQEVEIHLPAAGVARRQSELKKARAS